MSERKRPVHLVGSVPLDDAGAVFRAVGSSVGELTSRVPDGETGVRTNWIRWQGGVFEAAQGLLPSAGAEDARRRWRLGPAGPAAVRLGKLGYADAALASYRDFTGARERGELSSETRFQVSLPSSLAVVIAFCELDQVAAIWPLYQRRLMEEVEEIVQALPHRDLSLQWDLAAELCLVLEVPAMAERFPLAMLVEATARESSVVPDDVELGLHLCYGDPGHRHIVEPRDTALMVEYAHALLAAIGHPIAWIHLPVPRSRDDDAYFAPLGSLELPEGTQLFLGLVHATDGAEGAARRIRAARKVRDSFGVATECGFGRRDPATIPALLELHRAVAELD